MKALILLILLFITGSSFALNYDFKIPEKKKNESALKFSGNLDGKWLMLDTRKESPFYKLQFFNQDDSSSLLSQYKLELYFNGDYRHKKISFHIKTHSVYINKNETAFSLLEAYNSINFSPGFSINTGKRMYNWGKGYAFNPVGYINPQKNPDNPELPQEGILAFDVEYIKSFDSKVLRTFSFNTVVVPPYVDINKNFGDLKNIELAMKAYFLFFDTDVDFLFHYKNGKINQAGIDFSKNIVDSIELHGELSCYLNKEKKYFKNNMLQMSTINGFSYLLGFRFLPDSNFIIIGEYYHCDTGLNKDEFQNFLSFLDNTYSSGNESIIQNAKDNIKNNFNSQTLMQDYAYLKMTINDSFGILYLTFSSTLIYNINDNSYLLVPEMSYKPYTNLQLILKTYASFGDKDSEFGNKQYSATYEMWLRIYF